MRSSRSDRTVPRQALEEALALLGSPLLAGVMRRRPLPPDVLVAIKTAASEEEAARQAALRQVPPRMIREAAVLYLQTVVMHPQADHYRVLGAVRSASQRELRDHMTWLMKWLHPDRVADGWETASVERITAAWQALKSPERRVLYDRTLPPERAERPARPGGFRSRRLSRDAPRIPWVARPVEFRSRRGHRRLFAAAALFVAMCGLLSLGASQWSRVAEALAVTP